MRAKNVKEEQERGSQEKSQVREGVTREEPGKRGGH